MRFSCQFERKNTGERRRVVVVLSGAEVSSVEKLHASAWDLAHTYALRHAYGEVPKGFTHSGAPKLSR